MKKIFATISLIFLLSTIFVPFLAFAAEGIVPCQDNCTITDFFKMLGNIFNFIVNDIAIPVAVVALVIGGVILLISAGNPNMVGLGKKILWSAIIGLLLALCSKLIINFILNALGASSGYQV